MFPMREEEAFLSCWVGLVKLKLKKTQDFSSRRKFLQLMMIYKVVEQLRTIASPLACNFSLFYFFVFRSLKSLIYSLISHLVLV